MVEMKNDFKVLSEREHVLQKPGMYVGSLEVEEQRGIIDFKYRPVSINPALIKIVEEILQNSVDEHIRTNGEFATKIVIAIENHPIEGTSVTISDNGRGIPIEKIGEEYRPVLAWSSLRAGSNFGDDSNRITSGTHGLGLSSCFSVSMEQMTATHSHGTQDLDIMMHN